MYIIFNYNKSYLYYYVYITYVGNNFSLKKIFVIWHWFVMTGSLKLYQICYDFFCDVKVNLMKQIPFHIDYNF